MRRIVAFDRVTADGYFADPDGRLGWAVPEPEIDKEAAAGLSGAGTILFGRRTYEMFESFWPHVLDDSGTAPDPHAAGRRTPELRAMAIWINEATKVVFSKSRNDVSWKNSRLLRQIDPREVEGLKREPGGDMLLFGSGSVVSQLTAQGLVDEYQLIVGPVFLGSGRSLLTGLSKTTRLDLLEARSYPSGNVKLRYAPRK
jgi:dihydrofolate reductase